ncbi:MAG: hypothetical protein HY286_11210 [Planctomycetes bacterium]|nr:hypothetical protein [Planctomycetota bacterium]
MLNNNNVKGRLLFAQGGATGPVVDTDQEGLADSIEFQLGSSPLYQDTDGDGVNDLIEAVFGTNVTNPASFPSTEAMSVPVAKILAYVDGSDFHIVVAVNVPNGNINSISNAGGLLFTPEVVGFSGPQVVDLNSLIFTGAVQSQAVGVNPTARVYSTDSSFPKSLLSALMGSDGYAQFTIAFGTTVGDVTVADLLYCTSTASWDNTMTSLATLDVSAQNPGSGAFKPLEPVSLPPEWTPDSACFVQSALIGVEFGAILVLQGVSANCVEQQGTVCNPVACAEMVGRVFRIVDPCVLGMCK